jgi:hypothetical protein
MDSLGETVMHVSGVFPNCLLMCNASFLVLTLYKRNCFLQCVRSHALFGENKVVQGFANKQGRTRQTVLFQAAPASETIRFACAMQLIRDIGLQNIIDCSVPEAKGFVDAFTLHESKGVSSPQKKEAKLKLLKLFGDGKAGSNPEGVCAQFVSEGCICTACKTWGLWAKPLVRIVYPFTDAEDVVRFVDICKNGT